MIGRILEFNRQKNNVQTVITSLYAFFFLLFLGACSHDPIEKPPLKEPIHIHNQQDSVIQVPISIDTHEIENAIFQEIQVPLSSGVSEKITADVFATEKITSKELIHKYKDTPKRWFNPIEASYKYVSKDITTLFDKTFGTGMWVKYKIYLVDLHIFFEGSQVKISTRYRVDLSIDYEQRIFPTSNTHKIKGLLDGTIEADIQLEANISIDKNAQLHLEPLENATQIKFTKIALPSAVNLLKILKVTKMEDTLTARLLEEPINKRLFAQIEKQIAKKQVNIQLAQRIQELVYENSYPLSISKDLWLVPKAHKISISQVQGQGGVCSNSLSINVGLIATPQLITSTTQPITHPPKSVPVVCQSIPPKIYLYPTLTIKYDFIAKRITEDLDAYIASNYPDSEYKVANTTIYPSGEKLIVSVDLIEKDNEKIFTFYLSGTPEIQTKEMHVRLKDLDYTLKSKNVLLDVASWILDEKIKNFIQEKAVLSYKKEFLKLSKELSNIEHMSGEKIITGNLKLIGVENIFTSKEALIIHALATGNISYKINLRK